MALTKAKAPIIDTAHPWRGDPLAREEAGRVLASLVAGLGDAPFVISLKGGWGTGKSVFLKRLAAHLEVKERVAVVHVDAWKSDHLDDPLLAVTSALTDRLKQAPGGKVRAGIETAVKGLASAAGKILLPTLSIAANFLLPGAGGLTELIKQGTDLGPGILEWDRQRKSAEAEFSECLASSRDLLRRSMTAPRAVPILIIVDELDRCRPDFAIKFLERIKHFFDVDGVCFLIATDHSNLPHAVSSLYGPKVDGELYLRKFFDFEYHLPPPSARDHAKFLFSDFPGASTDSTHFDSICNKLVGSRSTAYGAIGSEYLALLRSFPSDVDRAEYFIYFSMLAESWSLQLRDAVQAHTLLMAFVRSYPKAKEKIPFVDCAIACLRAYDPAGYAQLVMHPKAGIFSFLRGKIQSKSLSKALLMMETAKGGSLTYQSLREMEGSLHPSTPSGLDSKGRISLLAANSLYYRISGREGRAASDLSLKPDDYTYAVAKLTAAFTDIDLPEAD